MSEEIWVPKIARMTKYKYELSLKEKAKYIQETLNANLSPENIEYLEAIKTELKEWVIALGPYAIFAMTIVLAEITPKNQSGEV